MQLCGHVLTLPVQQEEQQSKHSRHMSKVNQHQIKALRALRRISPPSDRARVYGEIAKTYYIECAAKSLEEVNPEVSIEKRIVPIEELVAYGVEIDE